MEKRPIAEAEAAIDGFISQMIPDTMSSGLGLLLVEPKPGWKLARDFLGTTLMKSAEKEDGSLKVQWWNESGEIIRRVTYNSVSVYSATYKVKEVEYLPGPWVDELNNLQR